MLEAIVAVYADWGIGCGGTQPLALHADRKHFRELTRGAAVIVGRRTLADFPGGKPLPQRVNIVLSRTSSEIEGATVVRSAEEALAAAAGQARCLVIGGASVYAALLPQVQKVWVTKIAAQPRSDSFFPDLDADPAWVCTDAGSPQEEDGIAYRFAVYERK